MEIAGGSILQKPLSHPPPCAKALLDYVRTHLILSGWEPEWPLLVHGMSQHAFGEKREERPYLLLSVQLVVPGRSTASATRTLLLSAESERM